MKTIKQMAADLGVSKQAIMYQIRKLESTKENGILATKENGILVVSLSAEKLIKEAIYRTKDRQTFGDKRPTKESQDFGALISILRDELKEKDKQIAELTKLLDQQQQLQLGVQKQLEEKNKHWVLRLPWRKKTTP